MSKPTQWDTVPVFCRVGFFCFPIVPRSASRIPMPTEETCDQSAYPNYSEREQLLMLDSHRRVAAASRSFFAEFKIAPEQTLGKTLADLDNGQWNDPALVTLLNELTADDGRSDQVEMEHDFPVVGRGTMLVSARRLLGLGADNGIVLLSIRNVDQSKTTRELEFSEIRYRRLFETAHDGILILDAVTAKVLDVNHYLLDLL